MSRRVIAHIDLDAFFYACEVLRRPELRGKPVVISGHSGRAVVTTASYAARKLGARSGMPAVTAARIPNMIFVRPDLPYYRSVSKDVFALVHEAAPKVQQVSIDEAYLDITDVIDPVTHMRHLQKQIETDLGLTCSIGIGPNKLIAKVCSDWQKPHGFTMMSVQQAQKNFSQSSPGDIPGIGPKTAARLADDAIMTIAQLQAVDVTQLQERFGERTGQFLHNRSLFLDDGEVETERIRKSISVECTYTDDLQSADEINDELTRLATDLHQQCVKSETLGRTVGIKVRTSDWTTLTRAKTFGQYHNDAETLMATAHQLFKTLPTDLPVRLLGVRLTSLEAVEKLEANNKPERYEQLQLSIDD